MAGLLEQLAFTLLSMEGFAFAGILVTTHDDHLKNHLKIKNKMDYQIAGRALLINIATSDIKTIEWQSSCIPCIQSTR